MKVGMGKWEFPHPGGFLAELEGADAQPQHVLPNLCHLQGKTGQLGVEIRDLGGKNRDLGVGFVAVAPGAVPGALGRVWDCPEIPWGNLGGNLSGFVEI